MADSDSDSVVSSSASAKIKDLIEEEPMYYVLGQFLMTDNGKNIATIMQEITSELRNLSSEIHSLKKQLQLQVPVSVATDQSVSVTQQV